MYPARESDLRVKFKSIDNCGEGGCHARVWIPPSQVQGTIDVVLMFHGGGFGAGDDCDVPAPEVDYLLSKGVVVVSSQYRLAPHVKFPDIVEDLCDAYGWVWEKLVEEIPGADGISGVALEGWSAGAAACCMIPPYIAKRGLPKPTAIDVHYGWFDYDSPLTLNLDAGIPYDLDALLAEPVSPGIAHSKNAKKPTAARFLWLTEAISTGKLLLFLSPEGTTRPIPSDYNPIQLVTPDFPPTFVMIATKDQLIPVKQSHDYIEALKRNGVPHASAEADMMHGQSEILPMENKADYERWFEQAIRPGLDYVLARFADARAAA